MPATAVEIDHLVVAAHSLAQGLAWCETTLGVLHGAGGKHAFMGTHNRLLVIGSAALPHSLATQLLDPAAPPRYAA